MPTLADYWRMKQRRAASRDPQGKVVDFSGPQTAFDVEEAQVR
jgi:hypothetical protein